jgi:hypothetical protein
MSEMTSAQGIPTYERPHNGARRVVSWGAGAALASPFVALFGVAVGASIYADDVSHVAGSGRFTVATVTALVALLLLGLGLVALYLRQEHALGAFGTAAFVLALVGTVLAAGGAWDQVFTVPYLANEAPAVLDGETSGSLLAGFFLSYTILALGWALFAIATRRAGVFPRSGSTVLLVGGVLAFVPAPTALRLLVLTIGAALLARAALAKAPRMSSALAVAAALLIAGCGGEDRLSDEEAAQRINEIFGATTGVVQHQFHPIFQQLEGVPEDAGVPERVRPQLDQPAGAVARELRETADRVEALNPPEDAEEAVDSLAESAREQAARLEQLPEQEGLTVRELAGAVEPPTDELRRLREAGIEVQPPPESGG